MKIRFVTAPAYVCERQVPHYDSHLEVFVGLELDQVEFTEDGEKVRVKLEHVLRSLMNARKNALVAINYWSGHWLRVLLMLDEYVYFPRKACEVIPEEKTMLQVL